MTSKVLNLLKWFKLHPSGKDQKVNPAWTTSTVANWDVITEIMSGKISDTNIRQVNNIELCILFLIKTKNKDNFLFFYYYKIFKLKNKQYFFFLLLLSYYYNNNQIFKKIYLNNIFIKFSGIIKIYFIFNLIFINWF